jgi:hypothetical protein
MHKLKFINRTLYRLQRSYGVPVTLYKFISESNLDTGVITETYTVKEIRRALVEPTREVRSFVYDLAYISANKDFTSGGFFDPADRLVVIDRKKDLRNWGKIDLEQFFMIDNRRFDIKSIQEYENNSAVVCMCRETQGQVVTHMASVVSVMSLNHEVEAV